MKRLIWVSSLVLVIIVGVGCRTKTANPAGPSSVPGPSETFTATVSFEGEVSSEADCGNGTRASASAKISISKVGIGATQAQADADARAKLDAAINELKLELKAKASVNCGNNGPPPNPGPGPDPDPDPGPGPGPNPSPPPPPPTVTLSFTGNPLAIEKGQSSTLTWSSNASCGAYGGWSGHKGTSGSESVSPTVTTEYELNCGGVSGKVKITVTEPSPPPTGVKTIEIVQTPASGKVGEERQLTAVCKIDGKVVISCSPWWRSSDSSRISVDPGAGILRFIAVGPARITVQWSPFETKPDAWVDMVAIAP